MTVSHWLAYPPVLSTTVIDQATPCDSSDYSKAIMPVNRIS